MSENKIPELLTDEQFELLNRNGLLSNIRIRDYKLTKRFNQLKKNGIKSEDCFRILSKEYPKINQGSIRKIIYEYNKYLKND